MTEYDKAKAVSEKLENTDIDFKDCIADLKDLEEKCDNYDLDSDGKAKVLGKSLQSIVKRMREGDESEALLEELSETLQPCHEGDVTAAAQDLDAEDSDMFCW